MREFWGRLAIWHNSQSSSVVQFHGLGWERSSPCWFYVHAMRSPADQLCVSLKWYWVTDPMEKNCFLDTHVHPDLIRSDSSKIAAYSTRRLSSNWQLVLGVKSPKCALPITTLILFLSYSVQPYGVEGIRVQACKGPRAF